MRAADRSWWPRNRVALALLVPALAGVWWSTGDVLRDGWLAEHPRVDVRPAGDGWATIEQTSVRLASLTRVDELEPEPGGEPWRPPRGYTAWSLVLDVRSTAEDALSCEAHLADRQGRLFGVPDRVPQLPGYVPSTFACGLPPEREEAGAQALFVLPSGIDPVEVRVTSGWTGGSALGPRALVLPVP